MLRMYALVLLYNTLDKITHVMVYIITFYMACHREVEKEQNGELETKGEKSL